jgi:hypothetical protein
MTRLSHSFSGFIRRVQMGQGDQLFIIVEGNDSDRYYYDKMLNASKLRGFTHEFYLSGSVRLPGRSAPASGKNAVLAIFREARRSKQLSLSTSGGTKHLIFCVDTDFDHLIGGRSRSTHLLYTRLPDVEAQLIDACVLADLIAVIASLPQAEAVQVSRYLSAWRKDLALAWRDWIVVCCAAKLAGASNCPTPGTAPSTLRTNFKGPHKAEILALEKSIIRQCGPRDFQVAKRKAEERVDLRLNNGRHTELLKGKWLIKYLKMLLEKYLLSIGIKATFSYSGIAATVRAQGNLDTRSNAASIAKIEALVIQGVPSS